MTGRGLARGALLFLWTPLMLIGYLAALAYAGLATGWLLAAEMVEDLEHD